MGKEKIMYKKGIYEVKSNIKIANDVYEMVLGGDTQYITAPGQFINIELDGFYLRRPISICDWNDGEIKIIYKVVGKGTEYMSTLEKGARLDVLTGLGNGFDVKKCSGKTVVVGGGVGVPPMFGLAKALKENGFDVEAVLGFNTAGDVFYKDEFEALGVKTHITTADGSVGIKGFVTDALKEIDADYVCCCGPEPMLKAVYDNVSADGQFSFEERMGCGFGACMGCSCKTKYGNKRICVDGPVLVKEEIIW